MPALDYEKLAADMDSKSPLEIMDHALATFGSDVAIAFSGAEDVALIEYAHLTGRPYRVFRCAPCWPGWMRVLCGSASAEVGVYAQIMIE